MANNPFCCRYEDLKPKWQNFMRENFYFSLLLSCDEMMFEYENLPASIDPKFLEDYLILGGSVGIIKGDDGYLVAPVPGRVGPDIDQYGQPTRIESMTQNGLPVAGEIGKDAVIIYHNSARWYQTDIVMDADNFSQIDKSACINVKLSRIAPLFSTPEDDTGAVKNGIKEAIAQIMEGEIGTITSQNVFEGMAPEMGTRQILDVTEPEKIQYIQYLSRYYDDLMRRHFARRGLSLRTGTKAAQQTVDEIKGMDSVSWYQPLNRLYERQRGFKEFNRIFNENVIVRFSEVWQQEYDAYKLRTMADDAEAENAAAETEKQAEGGTDDGSDPEEVGTQD